MRTFQMDGSPVGMRRSVDNANAILAGRKTIDLFECGRVDPSVPIEETVGGLAALKAEGKIGGIQLSEVSAAAATNSTVIDMVEAEVSLWATDIFTNGVAATCADLNITVVAHTPLGAGMLTGQIQSLEDMPAHDHHRHFPRFQPENFSQTLKLVDEVNRLAMSKGCTTAQLALSWIKAHTKIAPGMPVIVPVFGARSEERVRENVVDVDLTDEDLRSINAILDSFPVAGGRYPAAAARLTEY
jgi:pyridoxine 4-dehydrogenase